MIKVTHEQHHHLIASANNEIVLTGPPSSLTGPVMLQNSTDEHVMIRTVPVMNSKQGITSLPLKTSLKPGETRSHNIRYAMNPFTPAGTYEMNVQLGNENKKVKMIVHEHLDVQLSPQSIVLVGMDAGQQHTKEIMLSNRGNIAVTVPTIKHNTLTDMDLVCRNLSKAIRAKGDEGIEKTLDEFTRTVKKDLGDWVDIAIREAGQVIQPGQSLLLHVTISIPNDANKNYHYNGEIRMFDKYIKYTIVEKK